MLKSGGPSYFMERDRLLSISTFFPFILYALTM